MLDEFGGDDGGVIATTADFYGLVILQGLDNALGGVLGKKEALSASEAIGLDGGCFIVDDKGDVNFA